MFWVALFDADCLMRRCCVFLGLRLWCVLGRTRHSRRIRQRLIELLEAINAADILLFLLCSLRWLGNEYWHFYYARLAVLTIYYFYFECFANWLKLRDWLDWQFFDYLLSALRDFVDNYVLRLRQFWQHLDFYTLGKWLTCWFHYWQRKLMRRQKLTTALKTLFFFLCFFL